MIWRIQDYFINIIGVSEDEGNFFKHRMYIVKITFFILALVVQIQSKYYKEYGLSLRGLSKHHNVDPLHFGKNNIKIMV